MSQSHSSIFKTGLYPTTVSLWLVRPMSTIHCCGLKLCQYYYFINHCYIWLNLPVVSDSILVSGLFWCLPLGQAIKMSLLYNFNHLLKSHVMQPLTMPNWGFTRHYKGSSQTWDKHTMLESPQYWIHWYSGGQNCRNVLVILTNCFIIGQINFLK